MVQQLPGEPRQEGEQQQLLRQPGQQLQQQRPEGQQQQQLSGQPGQQKQQLQGGPEEQLLRNLLASPEGQAMEEWEALCLETQEAASNTSNDLAWLLAGTFPFSSDMVE
jgi:hypothetical protein